MLSLEQFKAKIGPTDLSDKVLEKLKVSLYSIVCQTVDEHIAKKHESHKKRNN